MLLKRLEEQRSGHEVVELLSRVSIEYGFFWELALSGKDAYFR